MSRIPLWLAGCGLLPIVLSACLRAENKGPVAPVTSTTNTPKASPNEGPPADIVTAGTPQVELTAGSSAETLVTVKIANGYHINGNPSSKYQIATTLDVEANDGVTAGKVSYPPSVSKKFSFSPDPIMVYEREVVLKQPLQADAGATKGNRTLRARLRVQPCDDTVCYPPRTMEVAIPINVK